MWTELLLQRPGYVSVFAVERNGNGNSANPFVLVKKYEIKSNSGLLTHQPAAKQEEKASENSNSNSETVEYYETKRGRKTKIHQPMFSGEEGAIQVL